MDAYDSISHIVIGRIAGPEFISVDGVGRHALTYLHDTRSGNGCGILGAIRKPEWLTFGERHGIFERFAEDNLIDFRNLSGHPIADLDFCAELIEASWSTDISDFTFENPGFDTVEINEPNGLLGFVGAVGIWMLSRSPCRASLDPTSTAVIVDGTRVDDVFDLLWSSRDRQHGYFIKPRQR